MRKLFFPFREMKDLKKKSFWGFWLFFHLGIPALLGLSLFAAAPLRINTLLLDMLPQPEQSRAAAEADRILGERSGREAVILAAAADFEHAKQGAILLYAEFENSQAVENISLYFDTAAIEEFSDFFYNYRFVIAGRETRELLETGRAGVIAEDALASAYGAFNFISLDNIETDPFLLAGRRMEEFLASSLFAGGNLALKEDVLAARIDETWYVLLRMTLTPQAVSVRDNKNAVKGIYTAASSLKESMPGLDFYFSGIPFHSYESSSGAQKEISLISIITLLIILTLFYYVFRSPLPVLFSVLAAAVSLGLGTATALLVFREIHIITFVFGTTLIGTCVDYSVHFFVHWKGNTGIKDGYEIRSSLSKSIIMSFISTEICFFIFLFAPFPILRQFAVFSMAGLLSSFLTSLCLYPLLRLPGEGKREFLFLKGRFFQKFKSFSLAPVRRIFIIAALTASAAAVLFFNSGNIGIKNDISSLYTMSSFMLESEKRAAQVLDRASAPWYFIVSGSSREETLENERILALHLEEEVSRGNLASFLGTSVFVPSQKEQKRTYEAMKALLPLAASQYEYLGFPPEYAQVFYDEFAAGITYCFPENAPINAGVSNLWIGEAGGNYYSCVLPFHPGDEAAFKTIAEELNFVHFINKAHDISNDLDTLTKTMAFFFLAAYLVVSVLVFFVYPWRDSIRICAIPFFLILSVLAVLAANKIPAGFFSAAAIVLVFGLGMDYIFYMIGGRMSGKKRKEDSSLASFAVALSFLTTLLSFGALAASSFVPVHIFGLTVSAGLAAAFISAMLLTGRGD